jgi:hypothetical protein
MFTRTGDGRGVKIVTTRVISKRGMKWRKQSARSINFYGGRDAELRLSVFVVTSVIFARPEGREIHSQNVLLVTPSLPDAMRFAAGHSNNPTLADPLKWEWTIGGRYWHYGPVRGWQIDKHPLIKIPFWPLMLMTVPGIFSVIASLTGLYNG